jgi:hypothetical protein
MKLKMYLVWPTLGFIAMGCSNNSTTDLLEPSPVGTFRMRVISNRLLTTIV